MRTKDLLVNVSACALVAFVPVHAFGQQQAAAPAPAAATAPSSGIQEIVVTAEKRTQSIQKSSLAITVHSGSQLVDAGVTQTRDITKLEPGVQIGQAGATTQVFVRGVGDFGTTPQTNPAIATNIDGVYVSRANSIDGNFYDLQRIEVLKGPQGTLYGRNASGGALNIITNPPKLDQLAGHLEAEAGDYNLLRSEGSLNIPVGDTFALRAAYQIVSRDGYASQGFDDDHQQDVRLSALWKPTDRLTIRLTGDYHHIGGVGPAYVYKGANPSTLAYAAANGVTVPTDPRLSLTDPRTTGIYNAAVASGGGCVPNGVIPAASATKTGTLQGAQGLCPAGFAALLNPVNGAYAGQNDKAADFTAQLDYDLGFANLTVIPAYRHVSNEYVTYPLITYASFGPGHPELSDTYSLEMRLGHTGPRLTWVAGAYLYRENQSDENDLGVGNVPIGPITGDTTQNSVFHTFSAAAFGQATFSITDALRLIGGLRYSHDFKDISGANYVRDTTLSFPFAAGEACYGMASPCQTAGYHGSKTWGSVTYKVGTEYDLTPRNMVFVTYATGQKAGGFVESTLGGFPTDQKAIEYNPEKLGALEVGSRNRFLDSHVQFNVEGFYWKYKDAQESYVFFSGGNPAIGTINAGAATIYGVDASLDIKPTNSDTLSLTGEFLHSKFDSFTFNSFGLTAETTGCTITPAGALQSINCAGKPLTRAPKWSGSAQYSHVFDLTSGATVNASVSSQFASSRYLTTDYTAATKAAGYGVVDVSLGYHSPDKKWSITAYVRNLTNSLVYTGAYEVPQFTSGLTLGNLAPPRTYGGRFSIDF